jgi:hypothetical protein
VLGALDLELSPNPPLTGVEIEEYNSKGTYHLELVDPLMAHHTTGTTVGGNIRYELHIRIRKQLLNCMIQRTKVGSENLKFV